MRLLIGTWMCFFVSFPTFYCNIHRSVHCEFQPAFDPYDFDEHVAIYDKVFPWVPSYNQHETPPPCDNKKTSMSKSVVFVIP